MATLKPIDNILGAHSRFIPPPPAAKLIQWSLDARRLLILGKRIKDGVLIGAGAPDTVVQRDFEKAQSDLIQKREGTGVPLNSLTHSFKSPTGADIISDYVSIIDIDYQGIDKGYREIKLPFIPTQLQWNVDSTFAAIKPIARNNSKYHYTGSEDKLEFEIDWHSFEEGRYDVITKCRAIEALSKGDAYNRPPHRVMLQWGTSNILFRDQIFVVLSAPYRLVQFNKAQVNQSSGEIERTHMLPIQAYQRVTLARITSANLSTKEIEYVATYNKD